MKFNPGSYLHNIPEQSAKCLMGIRLPLYAAYDSKRKQLMTFEWMPLDNSTLHNISGWKVISSLCYLEEMGLHKVYADRLLVILYHTHFNEGKSIFPVFIKVNNFSILQMDCIIIKQMKDYGNPSGKLLCLGLRYRTTNSLVSEGFYPELKRLVKHIKRFFFYLGNRYPIALIINKQEVQEFIHFLEGPYHIEIFSSYHRQAFRMVIFDPDMT